MDERTLSRREAASFCGVHYNTIRTWEKQGRITPRRVMAGGVEEVRIPVEELIELIDERGDSQRGDGLKLLRPQSIKDPETLALWKLYEGLQGDNRKLSEELAATKQLVDELRAQLERAEAARTKLTSELIGIVKG